MKVRTDAKLEIVCALAAEAEVGGGRRGGDYDNDDDDSGLDAVIASMRSSSVAYAVAKRNDAGPPSSASVVEEVNNGTTEPAKSGTATTKTTTTNGVGSDCDNTAGLTIVKTQFERAARPPKGWESIFIRRATGDRTSTSSSSSSSSLLSAALRDMEEEEVARSEASKEEISIDIFLFGPGGCAVVLEKGMSDVKTSFSIRVEAKSTIRELVDMAITESSSSSSTSTNGGGDGLRVPSSFRAKEVRFMDGDTPDFDLPPVQPVSLVADIGEREFAIIGVVVAGNAKQSSLTTPKSSSSSSSSSLRLTPKLSAADSTRSAFERVFLRISIPNSIIAGNRSDDVSSGGNDDVTQSVSILAVGRNETLFECLERLCVQRGIDVGANSRLIFRRPAAQGGSLLDMGGTVDAALRGNFEIELRAEARRVSISRFARQSITIFMTMDEYTASQYVEYNVVKVW